MDADSSMPLLPDVGEVLQQCAAEAAKRTELLGLRLGALFGILFVSTCGIAVPYFFSFANVHGAIFMLKAFAGGVVVATALIHILGDAVDGLADPCLGWPDFPWAMMIATYAALFTFTFEWYLHRYFTNAATSRAEIVPVATSALDEAIEVGVPRAEQTLPRPTCTKDHDHTSAPIAEASMYLVQSCTLEAGIIFHSIFIGLSLGLSHERDTVQSLMLALMFHQFNEGLAIGIMFVQAQFSAKKYWLLGSAFLLTTPVGVALGIVLGGKYNLSSKAALGTEGVCNAFSAGILLYNGLVDLIVPTFSDLGAPRKPLTQFLGFFALFLGAAAMSLIGKWA